MPKQSRYLTDSKGNILKYKGGQPVRLDDFDQGPTDTGYTEAKQMSLKQRVQLMLDSGVSVPDALLKRARIKRPD